MRAFIIVVLFVVALDDVIVIKLCVFCMIQDKNDIIVDSYCSFSLYHLSLNETKKIFGKLSKSCVLISCSFLFLSRIKSVLY